jgi:hypothetical protein
MPRRPFLEQLELQAELPRGNAGLWSIILRLDEAGPWTASDVDGQTNLNPGTARGLVRRLVAGGYATRVGSRTTRGRNPQEAPLYRLTSRPAEVPRLAPDGTAYPELLIERLWRVIKMAKEFTADELTALATTEDRPINPLSARSYCDRLARAGVLARATRRGAEPRYRLTRNLGARAPKILAAKVVYDPNAGEVLETASLREVQP